MNIIFEKMLNTVKHYTGFNALPDMRSNDDPLPSAKKPHGDGENQTRTEGTTPDKRDVTHQGEEARNTHVGGNITTSSSRDRKDLKLYKDSVEVHQEPRKLDDARPGVEPCLSNTPSQNRSLVDENANLKTQLAKQRDLTLAFQQSKELQKKLAGEKEELLRRNMEAGKQISDLQGRNKKLEEELTMLKGTLRGVQEKHFHTVKLLEERTADLKGAQTFLTTTDRYAGAEIMKMVEALNAEIFQGAALISELLEDETAILKADEQRKDVKNIQDAGDWVAQHIGRELTEHLSTRSKQVQVDPFPLQLAVQAVLTTWCVFMIGNFCAGPARDDLREIYRRIRESEPQAVAGRWRAMTVRQAKHLNSITNEDTVIKILFALLYLCASPTVNCNSGKTVLCIQQVVSTILDMWMQLRTAIQEGITTTDMHVFGANPNDIYQDALMNNIYAGAEDVRQADLGKETKRILCIVGMGLDRSVVKRNGDGTTSVQSDITLKAKVAFPSVLFESALDGRDD